MVSTTLSLIAFFALIAWGLVFTSLRRRPLARGIAAPQHNTFLRPVLNLERAGMPVINGNRLEHGSADVGALDRKDSARTYLARVVALTGATHMGNAYELTVGNTRFHVRYRYVRRLRDLTDPKVHTRKPAFIPRRRKCQNPSKLLPRCCNSRTIPRSLTGGPLRAGRLRPTARPSDAAH
jgi:hypothetical protein